MSGCEAVKERLCEFLDGELASSERAGVESHIQHCAACREELQALRAASSAIQSLERKAAPSSILAGIRSGIKESPQTTTPAPVDAPAVIRLEPAAWWRRALSAAAVLIVAALIYVAYNPKQAERSAMAPDRPSSLPATEAAAPVTPSATTIAPTDAKADDLAPQDAPFSVQSKAAENRRERSEESAKEALENAVPPAKFKSRREEQPILHEPTPSEPVGTPPNVGEGQTALPGPPLLQEVKKQFDDLSLARQARDQKAKEEATVKPQESMDQVGQAGAAARQEKDAANDEVVDVALEKRMANKPTEDAIRSSEQKLGDVATTNETLTIAQAPSKPLAASEDLRSQKLSLPQTLDFQRGGQRADEPPPQTQTVQATRQQVLRVRRQDLARAVQDLERLMAASEGQLAWMPTEYTRKKDSNYKEQAKAPATPDHVVIRAPENRIAELQQIALQYQAQRALDLESAAIQEESAAASRQKTEANKGVAQAEAESRQAGKLDSFDSEYVQLVLEFVPETPAAAKAATGPASQADTDTSR